MATKQKQWESLLGFVAGGMTNKDACIATGIGESTLYDKLALDAEYSESLKKAMIKFKSRHLRNISEAGGTVWQASAWILERKFREEFGRVDALKIQKSDLEDKSDEELEQLLLETRNKSIESEENNS